MKATLRPKDLEQLLSEADELVKQINSDAIKDMEEEHRIQFEMHARSLKKLRSEVQEKMAREGAPEDGTYSEGMHQAILDIVRAMENLGSNLRSSARSVDKI
jgi:hypothetical protein